MRVLSRSLWLLPNSMRGWLFFGPLLTERGLRRKFAGGSTFGLRWFPDFRAAEMPRAGRTPVTTVPQMDRRLKLEIMPQPDPFTCGPTCLHAVYRYYGDDISLETVVRESPQLEDGGTLAVLLACHALRRGYEATMYTYNLNVFDPTWFKRGAPTLRERLQAQMAAKNLPKLQAATRAYLEFLELGGRLRMQDLTSELIREHLKKSEPILTGLSATYLYRDKREFGPRSEPDDVRGIPAGHFVVLCGYDRVRRTVLVADPLLPNPMAPESKYAVEIDRLKCAILLGIVTYDANLLVIRPRINHEGTPGAHSDRR